MRPHSYPSGKPRGKAVCVRCGLPEYREYKQPECDGPIEALGVGDEPEDLDDLDWGGWDSHLSRSTRRKGSKGARYAACYESHPALKLGNGTAGFKVYGGSCSTPVVKDADVYVGLDWGMKITRPTYPWDDAAPKVVEVKFQITDMKVPDDEDEFVRMIDWLVERVRDGRKVHVGCIGGHGRTGMVLAALASRFGHDRPIAYVRENYCAKAVETGEQVEFLARLFGAEPDATGAKAPLLTSGGKRGKGKRGEDDLDRYRRQKGTPRGDLAREERIKAIPRDTIWGD